MLNALAAATLVAFALVPQDPKPGPILYPKGGTLVLPKATPQAPANPTTAARSPGKEAGAELLEQQRFELAITRLRRSVLQNEGATELELRRIGEEFQDPASLATKVLKRADQEQIPGLARILRRFGKPEHVDAIQLALLTRPFGQGTAEVVAALVALAADTHKSVLFRLLEGPYVSLQTAARDQLAPLIGKEDLPALVALSRSKKLEPATRAIELLGMLKVPEARARLVEALASADITFAQAAVQSLVAHGVSAAPDLVTIVERPAVDFTFAWAAFVLSQLEERSGEAFLTPKCLPNLVRELTTPEPFFQVSAALALARIAWRSQDTTGEPHHDAQIVDALMQIVAPRGFVVGFSLLERPVARTLSWFTGQDHRGADAWRSWWKIAQPGFVGMRMRIELTPQNAGVATLIARDARGECRVIGEQVRSQPEGTVTPFCVLDGAQMQALIKQLVTLGFMTQMPRQTGSASANEALPAHRLTLEIGRARSVTGFLAERVLTQLVAEVQRTVEGERWQLYRNPRKEPDFMAFWRAEREWLAANTEVRARSLRLKDRILAVLPQLEGPSRERAIDHLALIPELQKQLTEADGKALVTAAASSPQLDDQAFRLVEYALAAPGEQTWKDVMDLVDQRFETGGKDRLGRVFALLGADKVLAAIDDPRMRIRLAATTEVASTRDLRAVPRLLELITTNEPELRKAAIYSLGKLRAGPAREKLLEQLPRFDEASRRVAWVALGRIGGDDVLIALRAALALPDEEDRSAAIQALGEFKDPGAARLLAEVWARGQDAKFSELAMVWLKRQGAALARPALKPYLKSIDLRQRREIVSVLAEFQEPEVVPYLVEALGEKVGEQGALIAQVACVTGLDLAEINDRAGYLREWWRTHQSRPHAAWYLELLQRENVDTAIKIQDLEPHAGVGPVPELLRILTQSTNPRVRMLTIAMLRQVTDQDFGSLPLQAPDEAVRGLVDRYRFWAEKQQAARK